jgi:hypothetical protein
MYKILGVLILIFAIGYAVRNTELGSTVVLSAAVVAFLFRKQIVGFVKS